MAKAKSFMEVFGQMSAVWRAGDMLSVYQFYRKPFSFNMLANPYEKDEAGLFAFNDGRPMDNKRTRKILNWLEAEKNILFHGWEKVYESDELTEIANKAMPQHRIHLFSEESEIYAIRNGGKGLKATYFLPRTLDDFINDCQRAQVGLIWNNIIVESFNFK